RVLAVLAHEQAVGSRIDTPVDVAHGVALLIRAMSCELLACTAIRRAMRARDESFDDASCDELESAQPLEHVRRQQCGRRAHAMPGGFTRSRRRSTTSSELMPSASAWKFSRIRWRSTGAASRRMSPGAT